MINDIKQSMLAAAMLMALFGCGKAATSSEQVTREFSVDKLFETDGCTVYRFSDYGSPRYFTNCKGSTEWRESCGKNCNRDMQINGAN